MGGAVPRRDSAPRERPREEWIEIPVPAIVDEPTFARAQELLHENKVHARRRTIEPSLVQGLVSCRKCGYSFSRISTRSTARRIQYYRCIGSDRWRHLAGPAVRCASGPAGPAGRGGMDRSAAVARGAGPDPTGTGSPAGRRPGCRPQADSDAGRGAGPCTRGQDHRAVAHRLPGGLGVARPTTRADAVAASTRADAATGAERAGGTDSRPRPRICVSPKRSRRF